MTAPRVHRCTSDSLQGRKMRSAKGAVVSDDTKIPAEIREHNARIEAERQARLARRKAK